MALSANKRLLLLGMGVSLAAHVLVGAIIGFTAPSAPAGEAEESLILFDIEEAPPPPEAEVPAAQEPPPVPEEVPPPPPAPQPEPPEDEAIAEPTPEPPDSDDEGDKVADTSTYDAGVEDAAASDGDARGAVEDAGASEGDALLVAATDDAGAARDDAAAVLATPLASDAGAGAEGTDVIAASQTGDAGTAEQPGDEGAGDGTGDPMAGGPRSAGADANLTSYFPAGHVVTAMIRFDRLRGTPWAPQTEAILAPMPDYQSLIGRRKVSITQLFDTLIISTPEPRNVTATTLVGHASIAGSAARAFIDHRDAPVRWYTGRGGPVGERQSSPLVARGDKRVFLIPTPGWVLLSQPEHFGNLLEPAPGDIDSAQAPPSELPSWLADLPRIEDEAGAASGPALLVTIAGMLPPSYRAPYVGVLPLPERLTLALEVTQGGFYVRGTMSFPNEQRADAFVAAATKAKDELAESRLFKIMLTQAHAYNAVRGLSLRRNGTRVGYATSISVADSRAMMALAAQWTQQFFSPPANVPPAAAPTPPPPTEPGPAEQSPPALPPAAPGQSSPAPAAPKPPSEPTEGGP